MHRKKTLSCTDLGVELGAGPPGHGPLVDLLTLRGRVGRYLGLVDAVELLEVLAQHQQQQAALGRGDRLDKARHVGGQPAEHAVLVVVEILIVHGLLPGDLFKILVSDRIFLIPHLPVSGTNLISYSAGRLSDSLMDWRMLQPMTDTIMSMWWMRKSGSSITV